MDLADRLAVVEAENEALRDQLVALEEAFGLATPMPVEWRLTGSETRVVGPLLARTRCSRNALMAALYRDVGKDEPELKIIDVFICKVRKKLKPFGIEIQNMWGEGYFMSPESKRIAQAMIDGGGFVRGELYPQETEVRP